MKSGLTLGLVFPSSALLAVHRMKFGCHLAVVAWAQGHCVCGQITRARGIFVAKLHPGERFLNPWNPQGEKDVQTTYINPPSYK